MEILANNHKTILAGIATLIARNNTKIVLSTIEFTTIFPICGFLYGEVPK